MACLVLIAFFTGCTAEEVDSPTPPSTSTSDDTSSSVGDVSLLAVGSGSWIAISDGSDGPSSETLRSRLVVANTGCHVADARELAPILLLFPTSAAPADEDGGPAIEVGGQRYAVDSKPTFTGDRVRLNGDQLAQVARCEPYGDVFRVASMTK